MKVKVKHQVKHLISNKIEPNQFYVMMKLKSTWSPYIEGLLLLSDKVATAKLIYSFVGLWARPTLL